jgi:hypothetical protein
MREELGLQGMVADSRVQLATLALEQAPGRSRIDGA